MVLSNLKRVSLVLVTKFRVSELVNYGIVFATQSTLFKTFCLYFTREKNLKFQHVNAQSRVHEPKKYSTILTGPYSFLFFGILVILTYVLVIAVRA